MEIYEFFILLLFALAFTGLVRFYALKVELLDIPNQRSSHQTPTPKSGGLAVVICFYFALLVFIANAYWRSAEGVILELALAVAVLGFWDDKHNLSASIRLLFQLLVAGLIMLMLNGLPKFIVGPFTIDLAWPGYLLGLIYLIWMLNLFNFMDGTDGIAGSEAIFVLSALAGFLQWSAPSLANAALCLAVSTLGFLFWNWPRARIFMGDAGSCFLGLQIAVIILIGVKHLPNLMIPGLILMGVFIVDASFTLVYRMLSGQKWHQAHCTHAYQYVARKYGHDKVLWGVWAINLFWLLPFAIGTFYMPDTGMIGLLLAYAPLLWFVNYTRAGREVASSNEY